MPKPIVLVGAVVATVVVIGGVIGIVTALNNPKNNNQTSTTTSSSSKKVTLDDPDGVYNFFSDPSVTKYPEANALFGNGQTFTFEYDGSKTMNDSYAKLSYQLYYIQDNGKVIPIGGGNLDGTGSGTFSTSDKVFDSNTKDRTGFFELQGTYTEGTSGTNVKLGMYPITFDYAE